MRLFRVEGTPNRYHMQRLKDKTHAQTWSSDAVCLFSTQPLVLRLKQGIPERYWISTSVHRHVTVRDLRWTHHMWQYWVGTSVTLQKCRDKYSMSRVSAGAWRHGPWKNVEVHIAQPPQLALMILLRFALTLSQPDWGGDVARWNAGVRRHLNNMQTRERERNHDIKTLLSLLFKNIRNSKSFYCSVVWNYC